MRGEGKTAGGAGVTGAQWVSIRGQLSQFFLFFRRASQFSFSLILYIPLNPVW